MKIMLNGDPYEIEPGTSVERLIERHGLASGPCAAEVNSVLVPKRNHADTLLEEGDRVELVTLVGGG